MASSSSSSRGRAIRVEGLPELQRAFAVADKTLGKELNRGLRKAAEPVATDAASMALSGIPKIGVDWSRMRIGVTRRSVYVAPRARNRGGSKRKNLAGLLLERSMLPALERNIDDVTESVDDVLGTVGRAWESA